MELVYDGRMFLSASLCYETMFAGLIESLTGYTASAHHSKWRDISRILYKICLI